MNQEDVKVAFYLKTNVFGKPRAETNSFALCRGEKRCTNVNETNAEGRCPVMGRLTVGRSECVFSAKMLAPRSQWVSGRMCVNCCRNNNPEKRAGRLLFVGQPLILQTRYFLSEIQQSVFHFEVMYIRDVIRSIERFTVFTVFYDIGLKFQGV